MPYHVFCHVPAITAVRPMENDVEGEEPNDLHCLLILFFIVKGMESVTNP